MDKYPIGMRNPKDWEEYGNGLFTYYKPHSYNGNYYFCTLKNKPKWPKDLCIEFNVSKGAFRISKLMNDSVNNKAYYPPIFFGETIPDDPPEPYITTRVIMF